VHSEQFLSLTLEALETILSGLTGELAASVFVVVHVAPESPGYLAEILGRMGPLPAQIARDGESFGPGQILVAPAGHHLLLDGDGHMRVTRGPRENRARPAVDPLFRSAALAIGKRVTALCCPAASTTARPACVASSKEAARTQRSTWSLKTRNSGSQPCVGLETYRQDHGPYGMRSQEADEMGPSGGRRSVLNVSHARSLEPT
jgi:hypothetical protein